MESVHYYTNALNITIKEKGLIPKNVGVLNNKIGVIYDHQQKYVKAIEHFQSALENYELNLGHDAPETNTVRNNLAMAYLKLGLTNN